MTKRYRTVSAIFYLVAAWAAVLGIGIDSGLINPLDNAPYREPFASLVAQPDIQELVLVFAGFIGGLLVAAALCIVILVSGPLRRNESRARVLVVILSLGILVPQLVTWARLGVPGYALCVVMTLIGLVVLAAFLLRRIPPTAA